MKFFNTTLIIYFVVVLLIAAVLFSVVMINNFGKSFFEVTDEKQIPIWTRCEIPIPEEKIRAFFGMKQSHPFLAEFDRKITLCDSSSSEVDIPIIPDTGGMTIINVFWFSDGNQSYLKLSGTHNDWCVIDINIKKLMFSTIIFNSNELSDPDHKKNAEFYKNLDWKYIGIVKYDRPGYEKNLVFEKIDGSKE